MTERMYRLLERLQKLDASLNRARRNRFADPLEIAWLKKRKLELRGRLATWLPSQQWAGRPTL